MKFCVNCGAQLTDDALFCPQCGHAATPTDARYDNSKASEPYTPYVAPAQESTIKTVAKIFMLLSCIVMGIYLIPLAWTIPMTVSYWNKLKTHTPVSVGFKVCSLLFVSLVAGILMLCDNTPD